MFSEAGRQCLSLIVFRMTYVVNLVCLLSIEACRWGFDVPSIGVVTAESRDTSMVNGGGRC